jgi:hypothetical protein
LLISGRRLESTVAKFGGKGEGTVLASDEWADFEGTAYRFPDDGSECRTVAIASCNRALLVSGIPKVLGVALVLRGLLSVSPLDSVAFDGRLFGCGFSSKAMRSSD